MVAVVSKNPISCFKTAACRRRHPLAAFQRMRVHEECLWWTGTVGIVRTRYRCRMRFVCLMAAHDTDFVSVAMWVWGCRVHGQMPVTAGIRLMTCRYRSACGAVWPTHGQEVGSPARLKKYASMYNATNKAMPTYTKSCGTRPALQEPRARQRLCCKDNPAFEAPAPGQ